MIEKLQHKYALSEQGAKDMVKAFGACTLANLAQMMPVGILFMMTGDLFDGGIQKNHATLYVWGSVICLLLIAFTEYLQYNATFFSTYVESGVRRRSLAEKLRKIPLSFFGKKDLADLTNTIMADCAMLETASSHWLPELVGAFISTTIVVLSLFFFDARMAAAAVWVLPAAFIIVFSSRSVMHQVNRRGSRYRVACLDGIQEALETVRDLKAYNAQDAYMEGLNQKIKAVESHNIFSEFLNAAFVCSAQMILKFGIGTVAIAGSSLLLIRIGKKDATDEEVRAAAKLARCDEFIEKLPEGYDTCIGENGSELSGGERQRISIARAFLKDAPIILMDEATASLDVDNESLIQEALSDLIKNKTVLIIAHRMRTVDGADKVVVLKNGKVAESDTPAKLRENDGIYSHMLSVQMQTEGWKLPTICP